MRAAYVAALRDAADLVHRRGGNGIRLAAAADAQERWYLEQGAL